MRAGIDLISDNGRPSGIHSYTNCLLAAMLDAADAGEEFADLELVVFCHDDFAWSFPIAERPRVQLVTSGAPAPGAARRRVLQQTRVPALARSHGVDLVHSFNNVLPLRLAVPGVVTVHDLSPFVLPERFGVIKRGFLRWAVPRSVRRAAAVVAISQATRDELLRRVPGTHPEKIFTLHNGVDARYGSESAPDVEDGAGARAALCIGGRTLPDAFLLTVGAAEPGKNLEGTARALELIKERHGLDIPWVLAGATGRGLRALERRWRASPIAGNVCALGVVAAADLHALYRAATALVFPSRYEGFGLPLVEALASGLPAVTSAGPSALDEVAGRAAVKVQPEEPEDIARGILRVWRHREVRELLRLRGPARAREFTWERSALGVLDIYRRLAGKAPGEAREVGAAVAASA